MSMAETPMKETRPVYRRGTGRIIEWYVRNDCFFYPLVFWQFHTGARSSETFGLTWAEVNLEAGTVSITKSRNTGTTAATKTGNSERIISIDDILVRVLNYYRLVNWGSSTCS